VGGDEVVGDTVAVHELDEVFHPAVRVVGGRSAYLQLGTRSLECKCCLPVEFKVGGLLGVPRWAILSTTFPEIVVWLVPDLDNNTYGGI
jgi:hypothetical protein